MIDALFNQPSYVATKKMMDATALRHEAIAANIANVETPNYKRIDVAPNFKDQLRQALGGQDLAQIHSLKLTLIEDPTAVEVSKDGNNVEIETELMNLNENTMAHAVETQFVSASLMKLRLAITGRSA